MKNHPANAGGISVPSKLRLPIRLKVGLEFAFHWLTPVVCAFDVINASKLIFLNKSLECAKCDGSSFTKCTKKVHKKSGIDT